MMRQYWRDLGNVCTVRSKSSKEYILMALQLRESCSLHLILLHPEVKLKLTIRGRVASSQVPTQMPMIHTMDMIDFPRDLIHDAEVSQLSGHFQKWIT